jgi:hypothetical protein
MINASISRLLLNGQIFRDTIVAEVEEDIAADIEEGSEVVLATAHIVAVEGMSLIVRSMSNDADQFEGVGGVDTSLTEKNDTIQFFWASLVVYTQPAMYLHDRHIYIL